MFAQSLGRSLAENFATIAEATSIEDLFARVSVRGQLLRFDENVTPTMWRCTTVTKANSRSFGASGTSSTWDACNSSRRTRSCLIRGTVPTAPSTLYVDCAADGLARTRRQTGVRGQSITLQSVRACQQVFSAAFVAHVESSYEGESLKNELCTPVPHPDPTSTSCARVSATCSSNGCDQPERGRRR